MAAVGLGTDLAVAAAAFIGTNVDNLLVTTAMVAHAPTSRARRIAAGQVAGFVVIVAAAAAAAIVLYEFSAAVLGLLGLVPLAIGLRGLGGLWHERQRGGGRGRRSEAGKAAGAGVAAAGNRDGDGDGVTSPVAPAAPPVRARRRGRGPAVNRAIGRSFTAAFLVTVGAGGDNLAVYIPLFRVGGTTNVAAIASVFVVGEAVLTALILWAGRHRSARAVMARIGHVAVPLLFCGLGILVMVQAGTFGAL